MNDLLHELNNNIIWRKLYNTPIPSQRLKDEELILRFFAFIDMIDDYKKPLNEFLSKYMAKKKKLSEEEMIFYRNAFINTITFIDKEIGLKAFRPTRNLNMAAFDSVMYIIYKYRKNLKTDISKQIDMLFQNEAYQKTIRLGTTDEETISSRIKLTKQYLTNE